MPLTRDRERRSRRSLDQMWCQVPRLHDDIVRDDLAMRNLNSRRSVAPRRSQRGSGPIMSSSGTAQKLPTNRARFTKEGKWRRSRNYGGVRPPRSAGSRRSGQRARRVDVVRSVVVYRFVVVAEWGQDVGHRFQGLCGLPGTAGRSRALRRCSLGAVLPV